MTRANLIHVKTLRICLLLLLAVLLPVRGAVAATMLCAAGSSGLQGELRVHPPGHEAMAHQHAGAHEEHHDGAHGHAASERCKMCSACCSITPLPSEVPKLPGPLDPPSVKFPDVSSPAPTFLSDGQERPPRSI